MFQTYGFQASMFGAAPSAAKRATPAVGGMRAAKKPSAMSGLKAKGKHQAIFQTRSPRNESEVAAILAGNKFLNDEHKALLRAYSKKNFKAMQPVLKKLARMRDRLRKEAIAAADGKSARQIAGRSYLGVMTLGTSELVRLLSKKKISQARLKRAEVLLAKATAAEKLMNYWTAKIKGDAKKGAIKISPTEAKQVDTLNTVGSTAQEVDTLSADEQATQAAAVAEVEAEAPVAEVQAAAATENAAQVTAPLATETEVAALQAEAESAPEAELAPATETLTAAAPAAAEEDESTDVAPLRPPGMSMNMKLGLGAAALAVLLLATRR